MTNVEAWRRETTYHEADIRVNPWPDEFELRRYRIRAIITTKPSWHGARVGRYWDALEPVNSPEEAADLSAILVLPNTTPGIRSFQTASGDSVELAVLDRELPEQRRFPLYSEVTSLDCLYGFHGLGRIKRIDINTAPTLANPPWTREGELARHAIELARRFGIEPVKQAQVQFDNPSANKVEIDDRMNGPYGYKNLVLDGAIAAPIIWCGTINQDSGTPDRPDGNYDPHPYFLSLINEQAPAGTMAWCADEPSVEGCGGIGMDITKALDRVRYVKKHAPKLIPMITTGTCALAHLQALGEGLGIIYTIVQNDDHPQLLSHHKGSYFSCMAQGCGDDNEDKTNNNNKNRTHFPVAVIEGCPVHDFQGAIQLAYKNNANFALYYKITENLRSCWVDGDLYHAGGNGDGTAMYIDERTGLTMPSVRMMHWHRAQNMVEKQMLSGAMDSTS